MREHQQHLKASEPSVHTDALPSPTFGYFAFGHISMLLSQEIKDKIDDGFLTKPCIKCGLDHRAYNHKGMVPLHGEVWRNLKGTDVAGAEAHLATLKAAHTKKLLAAQKAGDSGAQAATPQTVPTNIEPMIVPTGFPVIDPDGTDPHASSTTPQLLVIQEQAKSEPVDTALRQANRAPTADQVATGHLHEPTTEKLSIMSAKFPLRKQFAKPTSHVLTNYFEVSWNNNTKFFVYEITDIPAGNKRKTKAVVKTAIQAWDFLRNNQIHFATDHLKFVVAWRDLHTGIQCPRKSTPADEVMWTPTPIADGDRRVQLYFKYHGEMNLDRLQDYVNPRSKPNDSALPDFNFNPLVAYLNTVIAKNLTDEVFQTSSHKFFFKDSHEVLGRSKSLCVMRGYDYTISPAMEKVLLNVNAVTSAFYRPITVAEFLKDNTFHQNERERCIKRLRVYIIPERLAVTDPEEQIRVDNLNRPQNRIKTVKAFGGDIGNRSDNALKFRKWFNNGGQLQQANEDTHVVDHMKSVFGHAHRFDENLKAVNVGSDDEPVWYPQEFLRILPYQLYNNLLPDTLIDSMLRLACQTPDNVRARIEAEGLKGLGIIQNDGAQKFVRKS